MKEKKITGCRYADGTHWYWGDTEVAVINEARREIEWCDRTHNFPEEVVNMIRSKIPAPQGQWLIEARRTQSSARQGNVLIFVNNEYTGMCFEDTMRLDEKGNYVSTTPDCQLGKFVNASLWHPLDQTNHYSDRFKSIFDPEWKNDRSKEMD